MNPSIATDLAAVVGEILAIEPGSVRPDLTADAVETWDSLTHLRLITAVEERFRVRFSMDEVLGLSNVGDLDNLVRQKRESVG